jgi:WD40 repeat protein
MNDDFLHNQRQPPRREFGRELYRRISQEGDNMLSANTTFNAASLPKRFSLNGRYRHKRRWDVRLPLIAALMAVIALGGVFFGMRKPQSENQENPLLIAPLPQQGQAITPENAGQIEYLTRLGSGYISTVAWSPDGDMLAIGGSMGAWLFDPAALDEPLDLLEGSGGFISQITFSPDGRLLAMPDFNELLIWDVATHERIDSLAGKIQNASSWTFNPDATLLAVGDYEGNVRVWDTASGEMKSQVNVFYNYVPIWALNFSPDGQRLAFSGSDTPVLVLEDRTGQWDNWEGEPIEFRTDARSELGTRGGVFSADGSRIAARIGNNIVIWDAQTGEELVTLDTSQPDPACVEGCPQGGGGAMKGGGGDLNFSPDAQQVATVDESLRLWNIETGESRVIAQARPMPEGYGTSIGSVDFSPDWTQVAIVDTNSKLRILNVEDAEEVAVMNSLNTRGIMDIAFNNDSTTLAASTEAGLVHLWDVNELSDDMSETLIDNEVILPSYGKLSIAYSPDGSRMLTYMMGAGDINVWDVASREIVEVWDNPHNDFQFVGWGGFIAYTSDGKYVASNSVDGRYIMIRDAETGEILHDIALDSGHSSSMGVFSANGKTLAVTVANGGIYAPTMGNETPALPEYFVQLYDVESGELRGTLKGHTSNIFNMAISSEGVLATSASPGGMEENDHSVRLWDIETAEEIRVVSDELLVNALSFSPDGRILAIGEYNQNNSHQVRLVDVETNEDLTTFEVSSVLNTLEFSADGRLLAVGLAGGVVDLYGVE